MINTRIISSLEKCFMTDSAEKFEAVNNNVDFLKRISIGDLTISGLNRGEVRKLSDREIFYLQNI